MRTIFRFLGLAILASVFTVAGGMSVFAQNPPATPAATPAPVPAACENPDAGTALYEKVRLNYAGKTWQERQIAVDAGEEYLKTYAACEWAKDQITYLNSYIGPAKEWITKAKRSDELKKLFPQFDASLKASKWDDSYTFGKQILALDPENLDIMITMGSIGLDETAKNPRVTKYNNDTLNYAKSSLQKIAEGKASLKNWGVLQFAYKGKENAVGWLNYTIGYITYFDKGDKKGALPFLYKAAYNGVDTKKLPQIYGILGDFYFDEVKRLGEEIRVKTLAANGAAAEAKPALIAETKVLIAQLKGYAERALDAYGRAKSLVPVSDKRQDAYRAGLSGQIDTIYNLRFDKPDGLNEFVAAQIAKPLPDPTTVPAPIVEADPADVPPATPGTTTPGTNPGTKPVTPATNGTKPAVTPAANGTKPPATAPTTTKKPVSVNGTASPSTTATAKAKPVTKKPVVKKKGTR